MEQRGPLVKLVYFGNSCIQLTCPDGLRIVCDPYGENHPAGLGDLPVDLAAEIVTVSHIHSDHNNITAVKGNPKQLIEPGHMKIESVNITGCMGLEGSPNGPNANMPNVIFVFEVAGIKIVHLGDSGVVTDNDVLARIVHADLVVVNIDGYVIPHQEIIPFMKNIKARTVLLSHYSIPGHEVWCGAPTAEEFAANFASGEKIYRGEYEIDLSQSMPAQLAILKPVTMIQ